MENATSYGTGDVTKLCTYKILNNGLPYCGYKDWTIRICKLNGFTKMCHAHASC